MKVLVACEFSGVVRDAFIAAGHDATSCDLMPTERPGPHYQGDVRDIIGQPFDLMVAHPPCTHLARSGARWFSGKRKQQDEALDFVKLLLRAPIKRIALENPISIISTHVGPPSQIVQPWQFGHGETKTTCLWLKNLPPLVPTNIVSGREPRCHRMGQSKRRSRERSRTYQGIADAMAMQWGSDMRFAVSKVIVCTVPGGRSHSVCVLGRYGYHQIAGPFEDLAVANAEADRYRENELPEWFDDDGDDQQMELTL